MNELEVLPMSVQVESPNVELYRGEAILPLFGEDLPRTHFRFLVRLVGETITTEVVDVSANCPVFLDEEGRWFSPANEEGHEGASDEQRDLFVARVQGAIQATQYGITQVIATRDQYRRRGLGSLVDEHPVVSSVSLWVCSGLSRRGHMIASRVVSHHFHQFDAPFPSLA